MTDSPFISFKDCKYIKYKHAIYLDKRFLTDGLSLANPPTFIVINGNLRSVVFKYGNYLPQIDQIYYTVYDMNEKEKLKSGDLNLHLFIQN